MQKVPIEAPKETMALKLLRDVVATSGEGKVSSAISHKKR